MTYLDAIYEILRREGPLLLNRIVRMVLKGKLIKPEDKRLSLGEINDQILKEIKLKGKKSRFIQVRLHVFSANPKYKEIKARKKFDGEFINENKKEIIKASIENAERLKRDTKILIDKGSYASAQFLVIAALEEIAKASLVKNADLSKLKELIRHDKKAAEIMKLLIECYQIPIFKDRINWAQDRIPEIREDVIYVRLKPTRSDTIKPEDRYWEKSVKEFFKFLSDILEKIKKSGN